MLPVCLAGRLFLGLFICFFISFLTQNVFTLIVYDRLMLLNIMDSVEVFSER